MDLPNTLTRLWKLTGIANDKRASTWNDYFDPIGLILNLPLEYGGYWCTPLNSLRFAQTGGDGVHYSLVVNDGRVSDVSPVVMTVPMCDTPNIVVGANLCEFLALGSRFGYFSLEQLIYKPDQTLQQLEAARFDDEAGSHEKALLDQICAEFGVHPWTEPRKRFQELSEAFSGLLNLPPREDRFHR